MNKSFSPLMNETLIWLQKGEGVSFQSIQVSAGKEGKVLRLWLGQLFLVRQTAGASCLLIDSAGAGETWQKGPVPMSALI